MDSCCAYETHADRGGQEAMAVVAAAMEEVKEDMVEGTVAATAEVVAVDTKEEEVIRVAAEVATGARVVEVEDLGAARAVAMAEAKVSLACALHTIMH